MSYKLEKPYTDKEHADFIVLHNHQNGRKIEETFNALYALEADEILQDGQPVKNPDYENEQLDIAKKLKLEENKTAYEKALKSGITYKKTLFDCDTLAAVRITAQLVAVQTSVISTEETIDWFDYNYRPVTLTIPEFMDFAGLVTLNTRRIETLNCSFNTKIETAKTIDDINAIEINYTLTEEINNNTNSTESEVINE